MENSFVLGDEVYHKALASQKWVVELIENDKVYCSTVVKETLEKKVEWFSKDSIQKVDRSSSIMVSSNPKRNNHW